MTPEFALFDAGFPIYGVKFLDNKTLLAIGGGGEGNNGIPNKITAVKVAFLVPDKSRRLQRFREIVLPGNEDSPMCVDVAAITDEEDVQKAVFVGCNQSVQLIKSMSVNNNLRKYVYTKEEHLRFLDAAQFEDQVLPEDIGDYPKIVALAPNNSVGCMMTSKTPSSIYIFNPDSLDLQYKFSPAHAAEIRDFHLSPADDGKTLCYVTENSIETISTVTGNAISSSLKNPAAKKDLSRYVLSKVRFVDNSTVVVAAALRSGKGVAVFQYSLTDQHIVKSCDVSAKIKGIVAMDLSLPQDLLVVAGNDFSVTLLRLSDLKPIKTFPKLHKFAVTSLAFSPNGTKLASGSAANSLHVMNIPQNYARGKSTIGTLVLYLVYAIMAVLLAVGLQKAHENGLLDQAVGLSQKYGKIGYGIARDQSLVAYEFLKDKVLGENVDGDDTTKQYFKMDSWEEDSGPESISDAVSLVSSEASEIISESLSEKRIYSTPEAATTTASTQDEVETMYKLEVIQTTSESTPEAQSTINDEIHVEETTLAVDSYTQNNNNIDTESIIAKAVTLVTVEPVVKPTAELTEDIVSHSAFEDEPVQTVQYGGNVTEALPESFSGSPATEISTTIGGKESSEEIAQKENTLNERAVEAVEVIEEAAAEPISEPVKVEEENEQDAKGENSYDAFEEAQDEDEDEEEEEAEEEAGDEEVEEPIKEHTQTVESISTAVVEEPVASAESPVEEVEVEVEDIENEEEEEEDEEEEEEEEVVEETENVLSEEPSTPIVGAEDVLGPQHEEQEEDEAVDEDSAEEVKENEEAEEADTPEPVDIEENIQEGVKAEENADTKPNHKHESLPLPDAHVDETEEFDAQEEDQPEASEEEDDDQEETVEQDIDEPNSVTLENEVFETSTEIPSTTVESSASVETATSTDVEIPEETTVVEQIVEEPTIASTVEETAISLSEPVFVPTTSPIEEVTASETVANEETAVPEPIEDIIPTLVERAIEVPHTDVPDAPIEPVVELKVEKPKKKTHKAKKGKKKAPKVSSVESSTTEPSTVSAKKTIASPSSASSTSSVSARATSTGAKTSSSSTIVEQKSSSTAVPGPAASSTSVDSASSETPSASSVLVSPSQSVKPSSTKKATKKTKKPKKPKKPKKAVKKVPVRDEL